MDIALRKQHGSFSWNELMTRDVSGAKAFYSELFGWTLEDLPDTSVNYTMIKAGDEQVGGLMPMPEEVANITPGWGSYVTVDNVDKCTVKAVQLGAKVLHQPSDIPNVGRYAIIADPQGAMLALITYTN